jgi:hypothetical protein
MVLGYSDAVYWKEMSRQYRKYLFVHGSLHSKTKQPAFDLATAPRVVDQQNGHLCTARTLTVPHRFFTDGLILKSHSFVESHSLKLRLGYQPQRPATPLTALGVLTRDLRARPIG